MLKPHEIDLECVRLYELAQEKSKAYIELVDLGLGSIITLEQWLDWVHSTRHSHLKSQKAKRIITEILTDL